MNVRLIARLAGLVLAGAGLLLHLPAGWAIAAVAVGLGVFLFAGGGG